MGKLLLPAVCLVMACSPEDLARMEPAESPAIGDAALTEVAHSVSVRLERGSVLLTVTRELHNGTTAFRESDHSIAVPEGAIATSLRFTTGQGWQVGTLLGAEVAAARWEELRGPGDAAPATSAMLDWTGAGDLRLHFFGVAPGANVTVEYELQLRPDSDQGAWAFSYPARDGSSEWGSAVPTFSLPRSGASVEETRAEPSQDDPSPPTLSYRVRFPRAPIDRVETHWALSPLGPGRTLWRLELDAAQVLEPAPARPNVVFVVDASHTEGSEGIAAQLELLVPYLANAPDAQVEVVLYRRFAERLFKRFVPAGEVARLLAELPKDALLPGNGSNLEVGAALAADALAQTVGPGRIVLFTDEQLRDGFDNDLAIAELQKAPAGTVVHVVARTASSGTGLSEHRDDSAALSPVAAATGGIFVRLDGQPEEPASDARALLGLVRPIRIDHFHLEAAGLADDQLDTPADLAEGTTLRRMAIDARPPAQLTLTGKIWARDFRQVVSIDGDLADQLPAIALGDDAIEGSLSEAEVLSAALSSHAVSRMTSYLAVGPDAAASTIGTVYGSLSGFGLSSIGCGGSHCGGFGTHCGIGAAVHPDYEALLRELLSPGLAACEARLSARMSGSITVEATGDEVVDVVTGGANAELAACLTEAAWAIRLTPSFTAHRSYTVAFGAQ